MAVLAGWQVAVLAYVDGGLRTREQLETAVAIAKGESGWNTAARGDTTIQTSTWGPSIGLWQVRSLKAENGTGGVRDAAALTNPQHNARSMGTISAGGTNWTPWSVYTNGSYRNHMAAAREAVQTMLDRLDVDDVEDIASTSGGILPDLALGIDDNIVQPIAGALDPLAPIIAGLTNRNFWLRVALGIAGAVTILIGLAFIAGESVGPSLVKAAKAHPAGAAATAVAGA